MTLRVYSCLMENNFMEYLKESSQKQLSERLKFLNLCECCDRHKINKPKNFELWHEIEKSKNIQPKICDCPCRHMARFICRNCKEEDEVPTGY